MADEDFVTFPDDYVHFDENHLISDYGHLSQDIKKSYELGGQGELPQAKNPIDHIFFLGMGGSSISGAFVKAYLEELGIPIPVTIVRGYDIPPTMTADSLVFAVSYSGNTEETVSAYRQASRVTQLIVAIEDGGKLEEITKLNRKFFLEVPKGFQPRTAALSYLFIPILRILERFELLPPQKEHIKLLLDNLSKHDFKKVAIGLSEKLFNKIPLIYASQKYFPVAYRFKTQVNEHAKVHAFAGEYSEIDHNEIVGYTNLLAEYHIVTFHFDDDHRRIQKRMEITKDITNKAGVATTEVKISGDHFLTKIYSAILIGDLSAYYLALRYKTDPSPVVLIDQLKEKMGPFI